MHAIGEDLEILGRAECVALLRSAPVGRVVYTDQALPAIQPVTFVLDGDEAVVVRTAPARSSTRRCAAPSSRSRWTRSIRPPGRAGR